MLKYPTFYKYYLTNSKHVKNRYVLMNWAYKGGGSKCVRKFHTRIGLNKLGITRRESVWYKQEVKT